jgi:DNA-binding response OmpR family regulator
MTYKVPPTEQVLRSPREPKVGERTVELRALEYALLCALATEPSRVFTRNELMNAIWGHSNTHTRTLDSYASRLRNKLTTDTHRLVINVWGVGYRLLDDAQP